ncbi:hypothetical protein ATCC90586_005571 [Pythium insidiosum]|nr:hypothetical protein ATCC90586_005571 [Pythium insidiosum]
MPKQPTAPRSGLRLAVVVTAGTRSHVAPIFESLRVLADDPTNQIEFVTGGVAIKHAADFTFVKTVILEDIVAPDLNTHIIALAMQTRQRISNIEIYRLSVRAMARSYEDNARVFLDYFGKNPYDLVICDFMDRAAMDVLRELGHRFIIQSPLGIRGVGAEWYIPDLFAPMPVDRWITSPWRRLKTRLGYVPLIPDALYVRKMMIEARNRLNFKTAFLDLDEYLRQTFVLSHHVLGVDPARSLPTNYLVFGPIVYEEALPPLEPEILVELERLHAAGAHVVFMAFGTVLHLRDAPELYERLIRGIAGLLETTSFTAHPVAFIWPSKFHDAAQVRTMQDRFPGRFFAPRWVNQRRALQHDAVRMIISHAGYASLVEAMYFGKPQLLLPFVADEFMNAHNAEAVGVALQMDKYKFTTAEMVRKCTRLLQDAMDPSSSLAQNVQRWQRICVMNNATGKVAVPNAILMAAAAGMDHLIPINASMTLLDRIGGSLAARCRGSVDERRRL